jgi:hypothetical protein
MKFIFSIIVGLYAGLAFAETVPEQPTPPASAEASKPLRVRANLDKWREENRKRNEIIIETKVEK